MQNETTTYIALLRGINIGARRVKMERLRELFGEMGFANVRSYIQTGNVFFDAPVINRQELAARIEAHLQQKLGYDVPVFLRTVREMHEALYPSPYSDIELTDDTRLLVLFTAGPLLYEGELPLRTPDGSIEVLKITPTEMFVVYRLVDGRSPNVEPFLKKALGSKIGNTGRFYDTSLKILEAARSS